MPAERMEIIFETADRFPGQIAFDVGFRNARYIHHAVERRLVLQARHATEAFGAAFAQAVRLL